MRHDSGVKSERQVTATRQNFIKHGAIKQRFQRDSAVKKAWLSVHDNLKTILNILNRVTIVQVASQCGNIQSILLLSYLFAVPPTTHHDVAIQKHSCTVKSTCASGCKHKRVKINWRQWRVGVWVVTWLHIIICSLVPNNCYNKNNPSAVHSAVAIIPAGIIAKKSTANSQRVKMERELKLKPE